MRDHFTTQINTYYKVPLFAKRYVIQSFLVLLILLPNTLFSATDHKNPTKASSNHKTHDVPPAEADMGTLKGKILSSDNKPAAFVSIALKGTNYGASTNDQGAFQFRAPSGQHILVISSVGLEKQELEVSVKASETTVVPTISLTESSQELKEVVVRAANQDDNYKANIPSQSLRLQTPLLQTPQNIQIVTGKLIGDQQIFDMLEGVSRNVSGVTKLEHWDNYARLNMRGSRVAPFRNGMNIQSNWGPLAEDMSMVERIEFVKGPAGFMMSNGEPGGFYNVVTKKPTGTVNNEVALTAGSFNTFRGTADFDGVFSEDGKLQYRLNLMGQLKEFHRENEYNNRYTIAPVLKYQISDKTSVTAEYTYQHMKSSVIGSSYVYSAREFGELPRNFTITEDGLEPTVIKDHSAFLIVAHDFNDKWKLTGQVAYFDYDQVGSSLWYDSVHVNGDLYRNTSIWDAREQSKFGQLFTNGELQTGFIKHRILAGIDYGDKEYFADWGQSFQVKGTETFNIYNPKYGLPAESIPVFDRSIDLKDRPGVSSLTQTFTGLYLQDELNFLNDKLRLTLAGRYTSVEESQYGTEKQRSAFTPRVGLSGSIDDNTSVYVLYDQAFVPQAGEDYNRNSLKPITGNNYEAGIKRDWFSGRWNTTLSVYQIVRNNLATSQKEEETGRDYYIMLGETQVKGVEFDLKGEIVTGLNLIWNYAYTDSEVTEDVEPTRVGVPLPGTTKHVANGWLSYRFTSGVVNGLGLSLGYQWQIERSSWFIFDGTQNSLPDYFRMDGAISWQNENVKVGLNINNLLDDYLYSGSPYGGAYYWQTEPPRNFRITVGYKF